MSQRIDGVPSTDQRDTDVISAVLADAEPVPARETADMPVVNTERYFRPQPAVLEPVLPSVADLEPEGRPLSHRRGRGPSAVAGAWCAAVSVVLLLTAGSLLLSQGGGTSREQVSPPVSLAVSLPPVEISVVPTTPHPVRRTTPRRIVPAVPVPVPTHTPRPTVTPSPTPRAHVSPSQKPPTPSPTPMPEPTLTPPETPGVSGVAYTSKETSCLA